MKQWKTIVVTAVMVLLVVILILLSMKALEPQATREMKNRTKNYRLVLEEQKLITEILKLRYEAAVVKAKFQPVPRPAPKPVLPPVLPEKLPVLPPPQEKE